MISIVDSGVAVVYRPLLPVPLYLELQRRGMRLVDVPDDEAAKMWAAKVAEACGRPVAEEEVLAWLDRYAASGKPR